MLDISIIVVNWNGRDLLARCLQCVEATVKQAAYEVIVIDNASTDGSQAMVRRDFPRVKLIENAQNVGFAKANNQGMEIAQGRYVLLLNSDAFVKDGTIDTMVAFMDAHPAAGMAACKLLYEDGTVQPSVSRFPTLETEFYTAVGLEKLFPNSRLFGKYQMRYWDHNDLREVDVILGAFMVVRREAIEQVGMMDERFFMYSEEVDWCYRFKRAGWKIYSTPATEAVHIWGGTSQQIRAQMIVQLYRSRVQFFRKHYGALSASLLKLILGLNFLVRVVPGYAYYLTKGNPQAIEKHQAFQRLLVSLPGF
jgi:GT2 family glycosyltransferase